MSREQLQRAALEMAVIVFGILLALGAEAAWQERGERQREVQILSDLLEEFRSNDARLTADIVQNKQASADAALWAEVMLGERPDTLDAEVVDAIGELTNMIAGSAKAQLEQFAMSLSLPNVILGKNHTVEFPRGVTPIGIPFDSDWGSICLDVGLCEKPAAGE